MKQLFLVSACWLTFTLLPLAGRAAEPQVVVMRVYESATVVRFVVSRADGKAQWYEVKTGTAPEQLISAADQYRQLVAMLYREGYTLQSTQTSAHEEYSTMIFIKP